MADSSKASPKRGGAAARKGSDANPEQYQRFLAAARELGCEDSADRIDEVVRRAAKMPPPRQEPSKPGKGRKADS